jgi:hypothetical protein
MGKEMKNEDDLPGAEVERRRDDAIRRALNTPPKPAKELVGKTERAQDMAKSRVKKARRSKPKSP